MFTGTHFSNNPHQTKLLTHLYPSGSWLQGAWFDILYGIPTFAKPVCTFSKVIVALVLGINNKILDILENAACLEVEMMKAKILFLQKNSNSYQ